MSALYSDHNIIIVYSLDQEKVWRSKKG